MRKHNKIRHTFPKTLKNPQGFEVVKDISSVEETSMPSFQESSKQSSFSSTTSQSSSMSSISSPKPTPSSSNMDMFRNMARKIGRR